jgi:hypothetical protein
MGKLPMEKTKVLSRATSIAATHAAHVQSSQSGGRMFGLTATAVFLVMLILNAISY